MRTGHGQGGNVTGGAYSLAVLQDFGPGDIGRKWILRAILKAERALHHTGMNVWVCAEGGAGQGQPFAFILKAVE